MKLSAMSAAIVFGTFFAFLISSPAVFAADSLVWSAENGSCVLGEGENAVTVTVRDAAVSFAGVRPPLVYCGQFLPDAKTGNWQTVLKNVSLDDVEVYSTLFYNPSLHPGVPVSRAIEGTAFPSHVVRHDDGRMTLALMLWDGSTFTKGAGIVLRQDGADIVGAVEWAKYARGNYMGSDIDFTSPAWNGMTIASESTPENAYGIDQLTFVPKNPKLMTEVRVSSFEGVGALSVSGGVKIVAEAGAFDAAGGRLPQVIALTNSALNVEIGVGDVYADGSVLGVYSDVEFAAADLPEGAEAIRAEAVKTFSNKDETFIFDGMRLSDITNAVGWMSGSNLAPSYGYHVEGCFFKNDGQKATCQFHYKGGNFIKCVALEMTQEGEDVVVKTPFARYLDYTVDQFRAYDSIGTYEFTMYNGSGHANVTTGGGYCITNLVLNGRIPSGYAKLSNRCEALDPLRFSFSGTERRKLIADIASAYPFPHQQYAQVEVDKNAQLRFFAAGGCRLDYVVRSGGEIESWANWSVNPRQCIVLEGGIVRFGLGSTTTYVRKLFFRNGAEATGSSACFGNGVDGSVVASGSLPSYARIGLGLYSEEARKFDFRVDDVTGDDAVDFTVSGNIFHNGGNQKTTLVKLGVGTMRYDGKCTAAGYPVSLEDGTLLLGASFAFDGSHAFDFKGGSISVADGTENNLGTMALNADAGIEIGKNSILSFSGVAEWSDDCVVDVTAGKGARLRIGGSACLSAAQLRGIRINGLRVDQQDDGSVVARPRPSFLIIR